MEMEMEMEMKMEVNSALRFLRGCSNLEVSSIVMKSYGIPNRDEIWECKSTKHQIN